MTTLLDCKYNTYFSISLNLMSIFVAEVFVFRLLLGGRFSAHGTDDFVHTIQTVLILVL